jgi:hypothetical protein
MESNDPFIHVLNPQPDEIDIRDIAHSLARKGRYADQTMVQYNVAQHSVVCAIIAAAIDPRLALTALLHDAAEAYIGDMPTPIKARCPEYRKIEDIIMAAIMKKFVPKYYENGYQKPHIINLIDKRIQKHECFVLKHPHLPPLYDVENGEDQVIIDTVDEVAVKYLQTIVDSDTAENTFLYTFERLYNGKGFAALVRASEADNRAA